MYLKKFFVSNLNNKCFCSKKKNNKKKRIIIIIILIILLSLISFLVLYKHKFLKLSNKNFAKMKHKNVVKKKNKILANEKVLNTLKDTKLFAEQVLENVLDTSKFLATEVEKVGEKVGENLLSKLDSNVMLDVLSVVAPEIGTVVRLGEEIVSEIIQPKGLQETLASVNDTNPGLLGEVLHGVSLLASVNDTNPALLGEALVSELEKEVAFILEDTPIGDFTNTLFNKLKST